MKRRGMLTMALVVGGALTLPAAAPAAGTGTIAGTVRDAVSGAPFPGTASHLVLVDAYHTGTLNRYRVGPLDGTGAYTITGLPAGDYKVRFRHMGAGGLDRYLWYNPVGGTRSFDTAALVHVAAAALVTLDVSLPVMQGAALSGSISESGSGAPLGDADPASGCYFVQLYEASGIGTGLVLFADLAGDWETGGLAPAGQLTAAAGYSKWCSDNPPHLARWYQGASAWPLEPDNLVADPRTFATAELFTVTDGVPVDGIDFALLPAPTCRGKAPTIFGTTLADTITGTAGRDVIVGLAGADQISGLDGNDLICGNAGRDTLNGGAGRDRLLGNGGNDRLNGNGGDDTLRGGLGTDRADGGLGTDTCTAETVASCP